MALVVLVLVLGFLSALPVLMGSESGELQVREGNVETLEAMQYAKQPVWLALINPLIGAAGVFVGAKMKGSGPAGGGA